MHHLSHSVTGLSINSIHRCLHLSIIMSLYSNIWFKLIFNIVVCWDEFQMVYKHHTCHAGKHDHDGWPWITVRPVPKRVFVFRYIESLGQKKSWLSYGQAFRKCSLARQKKIGCPGRRNVEFTRPASIKEITQKYRK